jgi:ribosome maturation factor RimP
MDLKEQIVQLVEQKIEEKGSFLVDVKVTPTKIFVFIDNPRAIRLEDCMEVSRFLQLEFENTDVFEQHELEVSSPGMDEPLRVTKQYEKRIVQKVSVLMKDGMRTDGTLKSVSEEKIVLEQTTKSKINGKRELKTNLVSIPFNAIKETTLLWSLN